MEKPLEIFSKKCKSVFSFDELQKNIFLYGSDKEDDIKLLEAIQTKRSDLVHECRNNIDKAIESKVNVK